jgi:hypothetical protein
MGIPLNRNDVSQRYRRPLRDLSLKPQPNKALLGLISSPKTLKQFGITKVLGWLLQRLATFLCSASRPLGL